MSHVVSALEDGGGEPEWDELRRFLEAGVSGGWEDPSRSSAPVKQHAEKERPFVSLSHEQRLSHLEHFRLSPDSSCSHLSTGTKKETAKKVSSLLKQLSSCLSPAL